MNSSSHQGVGATASAGNSSSGRQKLDNAGITGSGADADEDAF
jgi:hypothetical protein